MSDALTMALRIAGAGLLLLVLLHLPIGKHLCWREDAAHLTPVNASIFHVHTFFICLVILIMALPCLFEPNIFLEKTRAALWLTWSASAFWAIRLFFQWFVYPSHLWRGKHLETAVHATFSLIWTALATLFATCAGWQMGWLQIN